MHFSTNVQCGESYCCVVQLWGFRVHSEVNPGKALDTVVKIRGPAKRVVVYNPESSGYILMLGKTLCCSEPKLQITVLALGNSKKIEGAQTIKENCVIPAPIELRVHSSTLYTIATC